MEITGVPRLPSPYPTSLAHTNAALAPTPAPLLHQKHDVTWDLGLDGDQWRSGDVEISGDLEMCEDLERSVEMIGIKFKSLRSPSNLEISGDLEM